MTYDREKLLNILKMAPLSKNNPFHEGNNKTFMTKMGKEFSNHYFFEYGATKFVLIPISTKEDYVIKIPYTGSFHPDRKYQYAQCKERPWDYCAGESLRYKIAEEEGFEDCFAKTEFLGFVHGYPIYIQEKCTLFFDLDHDHTLEERKKTSHICKNFYSINIDWLTDFRIYHGEQRLIDFINFLRTFGWDDDLRKENVGYLDGCPVLIDYSGFLEEEEEE